MTSEDVYLIELTLAEIRLLLRLIQSAGVEMSSEENIVLKNLNEKARRSLIAGRKRPTLKTEPGS